MMLTPEQAKRTWCPMVRIARHEVTEQRTPVDAKSGMEMVRQQDHIVAGCNTDALGRTRVPASCCCVADGCAMWRWGENIEVNGGFRITRFLGLGFTSRRHSAARTMPPTRGYCGLAGAPAVRGPA